MNPTAEQRSLGHDSLIVSSFFVPFVPFVVLRVDAFDLDCPASPLIPGALTRATKPGNGAGKSPRMNTDESVVGVGS